MTSSSTQSNLKKNENTASRKAFVELFGPRQAKLGYGWMVDMCYETDHLVWWTVWEAARKWQRDNMNEK